jgi:hypothetical protein
MIGRGPRVYELRQVIFTHSKLFIRQPPRKVTILAAAFDAAWGRLEKSGARRNPFFGFYIRRGNGLRRTLKHRCFLTFKHVSQQHHLPIGKFQRIMMHPRVILVDLPEDRPRVIDHSRLPRNPSESHEPYRGCKGKLRSRKKANRRRPATRPSASAPRHKPKKRLALPAPVRCGTQLPHSSRRAAVSTITILRF